VAGLRKGGRPRAAAPSPRELEALWADLSGEDAAKAYRAVWALAAAPEQAVPFLQARLRPAVAADPDPRVARLITDLDDPRFAIREKATQELAKLGKSAGPALRQVLDNSPSPEVRRRAEGLFKKMGRQTPPPEQLRLLRAVEALEQMGTPPARQVLERLAGGAPEAEVTQDAKAALGRLAGRPAATP
jgi:HEAT repeat protein